MAKPRTKKAVDTLLDTMFDDGTEHAEKLETQRVEEHVEKAEEKLAQEFPNPPKAPPDPRANERAWESLPRVWGPEGECSVVTCKGVLRRRGDGMLVCKRDHVEPDRTAEASAPVVETEPKPKRARVVFREVPTTALEHWDYETLYQMERERTFENTFVKVSANLAPSEREGFDTCALKESIRARGALAVMVTVHSSSESPSQEAKQQAVAAIKPEDAIRAWFEGLPINIKDRTAATDKALAILEKEGG